jgi:thioesterase domain-containing protein
VGTGTRDIRSLTAQQRARLVLRMAGSGEHPAVPAVTRRPGGCQRVPLSHLQEEIWLNERMAAEDGTQNLSATVRVRGALDVPALRRAFDHLVARHEALRTSIVGAPGDLVQVVDPEPAARLLVERRLGVTGEPARSAEAIALAERECGYPLDLSSGGPLRGRLVTFSPDDHVLCLTVHHIVADGWSADLIWRDLSAYYTAERVGGPAALPPLPVQFPDYAYWQRTRTDSRMVEDRNLAYWAEQLDGLAGTRPAPRPAGSVTETLVATLPGARYSQLRELAAGLRVTPYILLCAAFCCLIAHQEGRGGAVIGSTDHGRTGPELDDMVGSFAQVYPLRVDLNGDPSFVDAVSRTRDAVVGAKEHSGVSLGQITRRLKLAPTPRSPFFDVVFQLQPRLGAYATAFPQASLELVQPSRGRSLFGLLVTGEEHADRLVLAAEFSPEYRTRPAVAALIDALLDVLDRAALDPNRPVGDLVGGGVVAARPPARRRAAPTPALVALRRDGASPALYCAAPISGSALCYQGLSRLLPAGRPVLGLPAAGLDGECPPMRRIEDIAAHHVRTITSRQPDGPYLLMGWSVGGMVAYEMARQLDSDGCEVGLVVMVEATPVRGVDPAAAADAVSLFVADLASLSGQAPPAVPATFGGCADADVVRPLRDTLCSAGLLPADVSDQFLANRFAVFRANLDAVTAYTPVPRDGRMVYIQGADSPDYVETWRPYSLRGIEHRTVPGDHYSMWSPRLLPFLVDEIQAVLPE